MYLIRNGCVLAVMLVALAMSAVGCQGVSKTYPPAPVNNTPLVVDEAMQIRDWDRKTSYYANGATVAGGTAYCWETADWVKEGDRKLTDAPVATLNILSMPVGLFVNSPFEKQVIRGEVVPPSYTGQPPLPGASPSNVSETTETILTPVPPQPQMETPPGEPGAPPVAPPAVETPPPPVETVPPPAPAPETTPAPAPSPTPETPAPAPAPAPSDTPTPPSTVEPVPPAPGTPEPPAPSSAPAPTPDPLNK